MKRGFFVGCNSDFWLGVVNALADLKFSYIVGLEAALTQIDHNVDILHRLEDAERGVLPDEISPKLLPVADESLLAKFQRAEIAALNIASRMDSGYTFAHEERQRLYFSCLEMWLYLVDHLSPQFVLFPDTPHAVLDHTLFHVCQDRNIPMLTFRYISALGVVIPIRNFALPNTAILDTYAKLKQHNVEDYQAISKSLSPHIQRYLSGHGKKYQAAMPQYLKNRLEKEKQKANIQVESFRPWFIERALNPRRYPRYLHSLIRLSLSYIRDGIRFFANPPPRNYLKRRYEALESSHISGVEYRLYKLRARYYKKRLNRIYKSLCSKPNFECNYVYVALQYQPERTSFPEGGRFSAQVQMVKLLARSVPEDWKIIVKENPTQLLERTGHGERGRLPYFYTDLLDAGNVELVPIDTSQFDLIDNARAVATLTGTPGFEAAVRGIPALVFGHAWYQGCEGVFHVPDRNRLVAALESIAEGVVISNTRMLLFLKAVESHGFPGYLNQKFEAETGIPMAQCIAKVCRMIRDELDSAEQRLGSAQRSLKDFSNPARVLHIGEKPRLL